MNSGLIVTLVIVVIGVAALVYLEMNSRRNARSKEDSEQ
jgi:Tfp pilus assembly protein PilV